MTDNSYELFSPPYLNHPRTCPKNANPYLPEVLSTSQQSKTDNAKIKMARHNQKYLGAHPEIKAIVSLILRNLFIHRPANIHEFVGEFVRRKEFTGEIAQFLMERLKFPMPAEEEEEGEAKSTESPEAAVTEDFDFLDNTSKASGQGDHKFLKKMLYGAESQTFRHQTQSEGSHLGFSYDQLLKMIRSSTTTTARSVEEATTSGVRQAVLEEEEEEDEEVTSAGSYIGYEDNEEALLEGQRLIFAMLGKKMTPSPSGSDISVLKKSSQTKRHAATRHANFGEPEDGTSHRGSHARASLYSDFETADHSTLSEADEDEEYFEKD